MGELKAHKEINTETKCGNESKSVCQKNVEAVDKLCQKFTENVINTRSVCT